MEAIAVVAWLVIVAVTVRALLSDPRFDGDPQRRTWLAVGMVLVLPLIPAYWIRRWYGMEETDVAVPQEHSPPPPAVRSQRTPPHR